MDRTQLLKHFETLGETPDAVAKLRALVRDLAIRGRLVPQEAKDDPFTGELALKNGSAEMQNIYTPPPKWKWLLLSQLAVLIRGVSYRKDQATKSPEPGYVPVLRANNIGRGLNFDDLVYVPRANVAAEQLIKRNDVLIAMSSGSKNLVGKAAQAESDFEGGFGAFCGLIRLVVKLHPAYFGLFLETPFYRERIAEAGKGIGINNLQKESLESLPIPIPPLAEQRRIVAKVEELLALCDKLEARQTAAREHRTRFVQSALDHLTTAKDESDFKKHSAFCLQHSELLFDSVPALRQAILSLAVQGRLVPHEKERDRDIECAEAGEVFPIPAAWQWVTFQALTESAFTGLERSKAEQSPDREHAYMKMNNITPNGGCDLTSVIRVDASADEVAKYRLEPGDFLFNTRNSFELVGKTCVFQPDRKDVFLFNNNMLKVSFISGVDQQFINLWCCSPIGRGELIKLKSATTNVAAIYQGKLATLPVPLPPLAEQQRIVANVDELLRWCDALAARLTAAQTTATYLLDATLHQILVA